MPMGLCREAEEVGRAALNLARQVSRTSLENVSLCQERNTIKLQIAMLACNLSGSKIHYEQRNQSYSLPVLLYSIGGLRSSGRDLPRLFTAATEHGIQLLLRGGAASAALWYFQKMSVIL